MRPESIRATAGRVLFALAVAGVCAGCFGSSKGTIKGTVARNDGSLLADTQVVLTPLDSGGEEQKAQTDARGAFELAGVKKGRYRLAVAYDVSGVFRCPVPYQVKVRGGKTLERRFDLPVVDVDADGTARLSPTRKTTCRVLGSPLHDYLCKAGLFPVTMYTLPPRVGGQSPYRQVGWIGPGSCDRLVVRARVPGTHRPATRRRPFGWLFVSLSGKQGWINLPVVRKLPRELEAWSDVAASRAARLPEREPSLAGAGLPDLVFTEPEQSAHAGDICTQPGIVAVEWIVGVRNVGKGLVGPRVVKVRAVNSSIGQNELRLAGEASWMRGLAPNESAELRPAGSSYHSLSPFAQLTLDPNNEVKESNETNNSLSLGLLPSLNCVLNP